MDFWKSAGLHLVTRDEQGWLTVTDDFLRAYITRPEIHPVEESCANEHQLFEKLMANPRLEISDVELAAIIDEDARENYRILLEFRDHLIRCKTLETAYFELFSGSQKNFPPVFIDQMVHLILRNILAEVSDPFQLRAAELFFRKQVVSIGEDQVMLADHEIVTMKGIQGKEGASQLLATNSAEATEVSIDVLTEENKDLYWNRSDNFDLSVDFSFTSLAQDALGRVIDAWIKHFLNIATRVQSVQSIVDEKWTWHIGCDQESMVILNALYEGKDVPEEQLYNIIALYRMEFLDPNVVKESVRGKPVYLAVSMNLQKHVVFKPQNLLTNLPLLNT